jgi:hypothetical protein
VASVKAPRLIRHALTFADDAAVEGPRGQVGRPDARRWLRLAVVLATLVTACQGSFSYPVPASGTRQPSRQPTVVRSQSPVPSLSSQPTPGWGPLAVIDDDALGALDAGNGPGRLVVDERCVMFRAPTRTVTTLVWRSGETTWDPLSSQIVFDDRDLGELRLRDGVDLVLGGMGLTDSDSPYQGAPEPPWIVRPDDSCPTALWVVHQVVLQ